MDRLDDFIIFMATMNKRFKKAMTTTLQPYGLNGMHAVYLKAIGVSPGITLRELSKTVRCDGANTSRAISILEENGFVCDDRKDLSSKKYRLYLTKSGTDALNEVNQKMREFHQKTLDELSLDEQEQFLSLVKKLLVTTLD